jgi:hypothetical protein
MWHFRKKTAGEKIRNPIQGEFFAQDAIAGPAQALVRESVQNSLDAASGAGPVRVRMTLGVGPDALAPEAVEGLFRGAWPHFLAPGNGLYAPPPPESQCAFLAIEDFGTNGLTGDPRQCDPDLDSSGRNPFFLFFRAEGLSGKAGTELGRWGVGKFVFPRSSLVSTHFGLTVRVDDRRRLLLGAATLKAHRVAGDDGVYTPDGLFGQLGDEDFVEPIEDQAEIDRFCRLFGLTRGTEPGLSVVVPYIDEDDISFGALVSAAARDYFVPILRGALEISIAAGTNIATLTAGTIREVLGRYPDLSKDVLPLVSLAEYSAHVPEADRIHVSMPNPAQSAKWTDGLIGSEALGALRTRLAARDPIAIRIPVTVRRKVPAENIPSYFDVILRHDRDSDGRPVFVREGIIVSDVRGRRATEIRSLVLIEDRALGGMLGDSENPAHTQWQRDSSNFKGRYVYGKAVIDFVTDSVAAIIAAADRSAAEVDTSLTIDFFSVPPEEDDVETKEVPEPRPDRKPGTTTGLELPDVPERPSAIRISRSQGGFTVTHGTSPPGSPFLVEVRCAYETRNGNALRKWDPADFRIGGTELPVVTTGSARVSAAKENYIVLVVTGPEFSAQVSGFDVSRDLYVRAQVREASGASQEA